MYYTEPNFDAERLSRARNYRQEIRNKKRNRLITVCQASNVIVSVSIVLLLWSIGLKEFNFGIILLSLLMSIKLHDWRIR